MQSEIKKPNKKLLVPNLPKKKETASTRAFNCFFLKKQFSCSTRNVSGIEGPEKQRTDLKGSIGTLKPRLINYTRQSFKVWIEIWRKYKAENLHRTRSEVNFVGKNCQICVVPVLAYFAFYAWLMLCRIGRLHYLHV